MIVKLLLVLFAGIASGFINVNAGGGSLLTLPALIFLGLPPVVANGTNRIAILIGAITATRNFKKKGVLDLKLGIQLGIPALIGAIIGSSLAVTISDKTFNTVLSCVMIMVLVAVIVNPGKRLKGTIESLAGKKKILTSIIFLFVGFYGGFIHAGVGFLIIAILSFLTSFSLVRINALKVLVVLIYMVFSLGVFILNGKVDLMAGLVLSVGNAIGAYLGSSFAVAKGDKWIRVILIVAVSLMVLKLVGIF